MLKHVICYRLVPTYVTARAFQNTLQVKLALFSTNC